MDIKHKRTTIENTKLKQYINSKEINNNISNDINIKKNAT